MVKSKKIIILLSFILSPIFMWGEINFFWDIGGGSIEGKIHKNDFKSDLSLHIGDIYVKEENTNLVMKFEPLVCNFALETIDTVESQIPQRALQSLYFLNTKISWIPIDTEFIWFGPCISVNYLNPFNISEVLLAGGVEFSLFLPFDFTDSIGEKFLPKLLSVECGLSLSSCENFKPYFYGKVSLNIGIVVSMLANMVK